MSTNPQKQKRLTRQVRIEWDWHRRLKMEAASRGLTIAKLIGEICRQFFDKPQ